MAGSVEAGPSMLKRGALLIVNLWLVLTISFILIRVAPSDPARASLGFKADPAAIENFRKEHRLDAPYWLQYAKHVGSVATGDLGFSYISNEPVAGLLARNLFPTIKLALAALLVTITLAPFLAVLVTAFSRWAIVLDRATLVLSSIPVFFLSFLLAWLIGYKANLTPVSGYAEGWEGLKFLVLPVVALSVYPVSLLYRVLRRNLDSVMQKDFIRTARAYGFSKIIIIVRYALRNSLIAGLSTLGNLLMLLFLGSFFVEYIFSWPGIGLLTVNAVATQDVPLIQGLVLASAIIFNVVYFVVDASCLWADPRLRQ
jgi:peptide/nickel transport system permease protein